MGFDEAIKNKKRVFPFAVGESIARRLQTTEELMRESEEITGLL